MAFFGITHLGYQNPVGDKMIVNPRAASHPRDGCMDTRAGPALQEQQGSLRRTDTCNVSRRPFTDSTDIHHGSHARYKEMVKRIQTPKSPDQLYVMPLTESQQYGWMASRIPEPWTQVKRFPRKTSEMTKFFEKMLIHPEFSLL